MKCPFCGSTELKVIDKRESVDDSNRRRRECIACNKRFTTYERIEMIEITVIKKDGRREPFNRDKISRGLTKACEKRPVSSEAIQDVVDKIEAEILSGESTEVKSTTIGDLIMTHLKKLDEIAYIRFASVYREFKDLKEFENELKTLKVVGSKDSKEYKTQDTTDFNLLVTTPQKGTIGSWDRSRITEALIKEINLQEKDAEDIAVAVEKKVMRSGVKTITTSLLRELVNNELFEKGMTRKLEKQEILGISTYNLDQAIFSKNLENSNVVNNNPEAVNLAIAESVLKQYALKVVFSKDVSEAHLKGAIHLHDLGYIVRVYCSAHSLEYIKKYGLRLNNLNSTSSPPKHASTLTGHLNTFLASMQAYYAGALGLAHLNIFYAPLIGNMSKEDLKQQAQYLIYSCSQNAFSRGGQTLFIDFNVHTGIPRYFENIPAIGPSGKYMLRKNDGSIERFKEIPPQFRDEDGNLKQPPEKEGRILTYADFRDEAHAFCKALMEVWHDGDSDGKVFAFPKMDFHISNDSFNDPKQLELVKYACQISSDNGSPYFVFDRDEVTLSACCRLRTQIKDKYLIQHPESLRFCGFQNVTINLPQCAYRGKTVEGTIIEVKKMMDLAMKAHLQKKSFITKISSQPGTPLWQVGSIALDGRPYIDLNEASYIIGMLGLNECVKYLTGEALHESDEAYKLGLKIASAMYLKIKQLEEQSGLKLVLEETPAESTSLRMAKVDLMEYPESKDFVRGNIEKGEVYYTNSVHFEADAPIDITERIEKQGRFNPIIEAGAITHVFVGEKKPSPEAIFSLIKKTWDNTQSAQLTISPEFTVCDDCHTVSRGYDRYQGND
jgi:ribonucleoside-triphosphate reductase